MRFMKLPPAGRRLVLTRLALAGLCLLGPRAALSKAGDGYTVTPLPVTAERISPVNVVEKEPGKFFVDFGQVSFGGLELTILDPQPGQKIGVSLGEALSAPQTLNRHPGGSVRFLESGVTLEPGKPTYRVELTPADKRLMPAAVGPVMPFRYAEINGAPPGFGKDSVRQLAVHYPFDDGAARFDSADPKLNAVWNLCKHTIKATSFGGIFIDGDRERKPYEADAYLNALGWYGCTTDGALPRYTWEYLITHPTWPTEWVLFSVLLAWEDYRYTGDTVGLQKFYADLQAKTLLGLERPDGLISTVEPPVSREVEQAVHDKKIRDIVDWPLAERDGYEMRPVNTVVNAFHIAALRRMAAIAKALNHPEDAARFETAAAHSLQSFNAALFDPGTGLYVDGGGSRHSSLHANFFPLAFGLVPPERQDRVVAYLAGRDMACSVYGAQFFLEALFEHGQADRALALMTAPGDRSWTHMVEAGATLTWEAWDGKYKPNQDWNHAWGAAPANLLPRKLLGVEPLDPGFARALISPHPGSLRWAEGRVPTALGSLFVRFDNAPRFRLTVELPARMTARVGLPVSLPDGPANALLDGKPVQGRVSANTLFLDGIGAGKHTIEPAL